MGEFRGDDAGSPVLAKVHLDTTRLTSYRPGDGAGRGLRRRRAAGGHGRARGRIPLSARRASTLVARPAAAAGPAVAEAARADRGRLRPDVPRRLPRRRRRTRRRGRRRGHARTPRPGSSRGASPGGAMDGGELYRAPRGDARHRASRRHRARRPGTRGRSTTLPTGFVELVRADCSTSRRAGDDAWQPARLEYRVRGSRAGRRRRDGADAPTSTTRASSTGTLRRRPATDAVLGDAPRRRARRAASRSDTATFCPTPVAFDGHAEHALVGVRGRPHQLRRRRARHHRPRQAAADGVRPGLRQRLVPGAVHLPPARSRASRAGGHQRVRRADLDRARPAAAPTRTGSAGACSPSPIDGDGDVAGRPEPAPAAGGAEGAARGRRSRRSPRARRDGEHGVGRSRARSRCRPARPKPGAEAATETRAYHERPVGARSAARRPPIRRPSAPIRYQVMSTVPEHWIPFIPVHVARQHREIQLQRAAMPRIIEGDPDPPPGRGRARRCCATGSTRPRRPTSCTRRRCRAPACGVTQSLPAHALARRPRRRLARRPQADRPRRGLQRSGLRPLPPRPPAELSAQTALCPRGRDLGDRGGGRRTGRSACPGWRRTPRGWSPRCAWRAAGCVRRTPGRRQHRYAHPLHPRPRRRTCSRRARRLDLGTSDNGPETGEGLAFALAG